MKHAILILNIISVLVVIVQIVFFYLGLHAKTFNTGSNFTSKKFVGEYVLYILWVALNICIVYSIRMSHIHNGIDALLIASIPTIIAIVLLIIFMGSDLVDIGESIVAFIISPITKRVDEKRRKNNSAFIIDQFKDLPREYVYSNINNDNVDCWFTNVSVNDGGEFFITYDKEFSSFVGIFIAAKYATFDIRFIGYVQNDILKLNFENQEENLDRIKDVVKKCLDIRGKSLFENYNVVYDTLFYNYRNNLNYFNYFKVIEKYNAKIYKQFTK